VSGGLGDVNNYAVRALATFSGALYAATSNDTTGHEIWRSATGDAGSWTQANTDGFGSGGTTQELSMDVFGGYLYVGFNRSGIAELWRSNGTGWSPVFTNGLGNSNNTHVSSFAEFLGNLYIGLRNVENGGQVWRSSDGLAWTLVFAGGLGNPDNGRPYGLIAYDDQLYLTFSNVETGAEVWRSQDGSQWTQIGFAGWGDSNNGYADYFDKGSAVFQGDLFIGAWNFGSGTKIWKLLTPPETFPDVPPDHWAWRFIEAIYAAGLTAGYPDGTYGPDNSVTRAEMSVFLKKGIHGSAYTPPTPDGSHPFSDIAGHWAQAWIEEVYDEGMTSGYPDGTYRPENRVTRAEMAIFLLKAMHGSTYTPPAPSGGSFTDVAGHWAEAWIEQLKEEQITSGYPDGTYRPENNVTRAEMAVFLVRAFSLPLL
jgi:hypothetical protein